ncbi:protein YhfH [Peribacillus sp. NPDC046944]
MQTKKSIEFFNSIPVKYCPECGDHIVEHAESYLMECDRCLSKSEDY